MTSTVAAITQNQSLAAVRNLIRAAVSCITYSRGLCSESSFEEKPFIGMDIKQLVPSSTEAITISDWIEKGAFDALNKSYLKEMSLCVYNADCSELLESYCFGFTYSGDGKRACMTLNANSGADANASSSATNGRSQNTLDAHTGRRRCSKNDIRRMVTEIVTKLIEVVENLPPLLSERVLTMRLTYYDEVTPTDYEPPCFAPASNNMVKLYQEEQKYNVSIGSMDTSHHLFSVSIRHPVLAQVRAKIVEESTQPTASYETVGAEDETFISDSKSPRRHHRATATESPPTLSAHAQQPQPPLTRATTKASSRLGHNRTSCRSSSEPASRHPQTDPHDLSRVAPLERLCAKHTSLTSTETLVLLLACFALSKSHHAESRGRFSYHELEDYLRTSCALDVNPAVAVSVMDRFVSEGLLQRVRLSSGGGGNDASRTSGTCAAAAGLDSSGRFSGARGCTDFDWVVVSGSISASVVDGLLAQEQVIYLLPHDQLEGLRQLQRALGQGSSCRPAAPRQPRRGGKRGRMSCPEDNVVKAKRGKLELIG